MLEPGELEQIKKAGAETIEQAVESTAEAFKKEVQTQIGPVKESLGEVKEALQAQCTHCRDTVTDITREIGKVNTKAAEAKQKAQVACREAGQAEEKTERVTRDLKKDIEKVEERTGKKIKEESKWARLVFYGVVILLVEEIVRNFVLTPWLLAGK